MPCCCGVEHTGRLRRPGAGVVPRHPKDPKYVDSMVKLSSLISGRPFFLGAAGAALSSWVQGLEPPEGPFPLHHLRLALPTHHVHLAAAPRALDPAVCALGLEPAPSDLRIVHARHVPRASPQSVSPEAEFVYSLAADLVREHGHGWRLAVDTARKCWQHIAGSALPDRLVEVAADDLEVDHDVMAPLEVEQALPARG